MRNRKSPAFWYRYRPFCATTKTCLLYTPSRPTAVSRGSMSRWDIVSASSTNSPAARILTIKSSWTAASLFSSCKVNERRVSPRRAAVANGLAHEPDRCLFVAPAVSHHTHDMRFDRRGIMVIAAPADGCVSRSVAADGRGHHPMAWACRRGGRTPDHGARGTWNERHSANGGKTLNIPLRTVGCHPHVSKRNRQLLRAPTGVQPAGGT